MKEQNETIDAPMESLPVELHKLLKFENIVSSGGEAKHVISEGMVKVNGAVETRRGRKLNEGDLVQFQGQIYRVVLDDGSYDPEDEEE